MEEGGKEGEEGIRVGEEGIGVGGGKEVGEGGRVERKEEVEIGLQAIVYKFSYVMEVFMSGGGMDILYRVRLGEVGRGWKRSLVGWTYRGDGNTRKRHASHAEFLV